MFLLHLIEVNIINPFYYNLKYIITFLVPENIKRVFLFLPSTCDLRSHWLKNPYGKQLQLTSYKNSNKTLIIIGWSHSTPANQSTGIIAGRKYKTKQNKNMKIAGSSVMDEEVSR